MLPKLAPANTVEKLYQVAEMAGFVIGMEVTAPDGMVYTVEEMGFLRSDHTCAAIRLKAFGQPRLPFRNVMINLPTVRWEPQAFPTMDLTAEPPYTTEDSPTDRF